MADLNRVFLMGNLTRDPEVRYTPKGSAVGELGLAINSSYKASDGQIKDEVCYVDVTVWGRQAETCKEYLAKGRPVFVEGRLQFDQWEANGEKKSKLRVKADRIQFMGSGSGQRGERSTTSASSVKENGGQQRSHESAPPDPEPAEAAVEDDIPF